MTLHRSVALGVFVAAIAAVTPARSSASEDESEQQSIRLQVPIAADAHGAEADPTPAPTRAMTPLERRRRAVRLGRNPIFAMPVTRQRGTGLLFRNRLHAPVSINLELIALENAELVTSMPDRVTLKPLESREITIVGGIDLTTQGAADFRYHAVVGDAAGVPDRNHVYAWPLAQQARSPISQLYVGPTHQDALSQYAIDIAVAEGTPVVAARAGVVVFLEDRYFETGLDREQYKSKANHVRILHNDGSMASYAHLAPESVDLMPGQHVRVGEVLGRSGNTGYSSGPHLHFAVLMNRDMELVSIPFLLNGVNMPVVAN